MIDAETLIRFGGALALVLALIAGLAWLGKRNQRVGPRGGRRLSIVEAAAIDSRSRAVLVRRDDVEHLIVLHSGGALVVESAIRPPVAPAQGKPA